MDLCLPLHNRMRTLRGLANTNARNCQATKTKSCFEECLGQGDPHPDIHHPTLTFSCILRDRCLTDIVWLQDGLASGTGSMCWTSVTFFERRIHRPSTAAKVFMVGTCLPTGAVKLRVIIDFVYFDPLCTMGLVHAPLVTQTKFPHPLIFCFVFDMYALECSHHGSTFIHALL